VGVTRRIVFPTIRLILLAVIAVALVKLAFGGGEAEQPTGQPLTPSAEMTEPQIQVARGSVSNTITLDATITADPAIPVKAAAEGKVSVFLAERGERVVAGDALFEVVFEEPAEAVTTTDAEGNVTETQGEPVRRYRTIDAPADGRVSEYTVLVGQTMAIGDPVGSIETGGFTVTGAVTAEQQYRLVAAPTSAHVTVQGGPAPFECTNLTVGRTQPDNQAAQEPQADPFREPGTGSTTSITCKVPSEIKVFDGLAATMTVESGRAEDVLVVPVTAVQGSFATGNVWVVLPDGSSEQRTVSLGLTDGEMVEVTEGLAEADSILEFVPVVDDRAAERFGEEFVEGEYVGP
jgi:membrane fusion protein, multidrug efflux system